MLSVKQFVDVLIKNMVATHLEKMHVEWSEASSEVLELQMFF